MLLEYREDMYFSTRSKRMCVFFEKKAFRSVSRRMVGFGFLAARRALLPHAALPLPHAALLLSAAQGRSHGRARAGAWPCRRGRMAALARPTTLCHLATTPSHLAARERHGAANGRPASSANCGLLRALRSFLCVLCFAKCVACSIFASQNWNKSHKATKIHE